LSSTHLPEYDAVAVDFTFVCDQDDPDAPAPLLSATMPLEGRLEYLER
jgi:hypothetical protein